MKGQRTIAERAAARWPSLARLALRSVLRLPPRSRARNTMLRQVAVRAFRAWNRGDFELVPEVDDPDVETRLVHGDRRVADLEAVYYGPDGHCRAMADWNEAWAEWDAEIDQVLDEGRDRVVVVARVFGEGAASGIRWDEWGAVRYTFRDGRIVRVEGAFDSDRDRVLAALATDR